MEIQNIVIRAVVRALTIVSGQQGLENGALKGHPAFLKSWLHFSRLAVGPDRAQFASLGLKCPELR